MVIDVSYIKFSYKSAKIKLSHLIWIQEYFFCVYKNKLLSTIFCGNELQLSSFHWNKLLVRVSYHFVRLTTCPFVEYRLRSTESQYKSKICRHVLFTAYSPSLCSLAIGFVWTWYLYCKREQSLSPSLTLRFSREQVLSPSLTLLFSVAVHLSLSACKH